jgi:hypothetical protein
MRSATISPPGRVLEPAVFRARASEVNLLLALGIVGTGLGLASLAIGVWAWIFATTTYGPAAVPRWSNAWFGAAPILGVPGLACLLRAWWLGRLRIEAHADGLRVGHGARAAWMPWSSVSEVRTAPAARRGAVYAALDVRLKDGRRVHATRALADLDSLAERVKLGAFPGLLEACRQRFNQGEALAFGPMSLTSLGVQAGKKTIQWGQVQAVEVRAGRLIITGREPAATRLRAAASRVPNVDVCVQLVRFLGQVP